MHPKEGFALRGIREMVKPSTTSSAPQGEPLRFNLGVTLRVAPPHGICPTLASDEATTFPTYQGVHMQGPFKPYRSIWSWRGELRCAVNYMLTPTARGCPFIDLPQRGQKPSLSYCVG